MDPAQQQLVQNAAVGLFVVLLMTSVGLDLSLGRILACLRRPATLLVGLAGQYLLVPLAALLLARGLGLGTAATAGLLLCSVAPGGPMGAYLALRARGDVALAASLVLVSNVLNTLFIPVGLDLLGVAVQAGDSGHVWPMARTILFYQLLPLSAGIVIRRFQPDLALKLQRWLSNAANTLLVLVAIGVLVTEAGRFLAVGLRTLAAVQLTVLAALAVGWFLAPRDRPVRIALAASGSIHSVSACVLLASTWFEDPATLLTVFAYSGSMFITGVIASELMLRRGRAAA